MAAWRRVPGWWRIGRNSSLAAQGSDARTLEMGRTRPGERAWGRLALSQRLPNARVIWPGAEIRAGCWPGENSGIPHVDQGFQRRPNGSNFAKKGKERKQVTPQKKKNVYRGKLQRQL